jgi:hypothetical protein
VRWCLLFWLVGTRSCIQEGNSIVLPSHRYTSFSPSLPPSLHVVNNQQFFFNFGPNTTTFIIPAEVYPSRVRGFAHGFSAGVGKFDASLAALLFNYISGSTVISLVNVLWIFFACNVLGAIINWFLIPEMKGRDADVVDFEEWQEAAGEKEKEKVARRE